MRAVEYADVLDEGNCRALLRVQRRGPDGSHRDSAFCKPEDGATGIHVSSASWTNELRECCVSLRSEVHGRPACKVRLSSRGKAGNRRLIRGLATLPDNPRAGPG